MSSEREIKGPESCSVKDGRFVIPCGMLGMTIEGNAAFSRAKGIRVWELYSRTAGGMTRSMVGIKTKDNPNGLLFNFCPFCGESISASFDQTKAEGQS